MVSPRGTELAGRSGEQIIGVYLIDTRPPLPAGGYVIFNVSDLGEFPAYMTFDGGVAVTSGQRVALTIHEPKAKPD